MRIIKKIFRSIIFSFKGLIIAWNTEQSFRIEIVLLFISIPFLIIIPKNFLHFFTLLGSIILVIICELINTAIENLVNRIDEQFHALSGRIKDIGSSIVFVAVIFAISIWGYSIYHYFT